MLTPDEIKIFSLCAPHLSINPVVFDVGAYKGTYTEMVLAHFPSNSFYVFEFANCYLFEPNEELYNELVEKYSAERVFNVLLSDKIGMQSFYRCIGKADELSSSYKREIFDEVEHVEDSKRSISIDSFCKEKNVPLIDFLKIDVEGAELDVLHGSKEMLKDKCIKFIQIEYGGTYKDSGITFRQVMEFVNQFGYKVYEIVNSNLLLIVDMLEDYRFTNFLITRHDFK